MAKRDEKLEQMSIGKLTDVRSARGISVCSQQGTGRFGLVVENQDGSFSVASFESRAELEYFMGKMREVADVLWPPD